MNMLFQVLGITFWVIWNIKLSSVWYCELSKLMSELSATEPKLRQITQTQGLIIQDIMQKPIPCTINLLLYYTFFKSIWPFWVNLTLRTARVWEHLEGLWNYVNFELIMINAISPADNAFVMSSSHTIVYWLNILDNQIFYSTCNI